MPFSSARGGVGSAGEGGGRLRWGRGERSLIIRHRPRSCSGPGEERPQQAGGRCQAVRSGRRQGGGARLRAGLRAELPPSILPRIAHRAPAGAAGRREAPWPWEVPVSGPSSAQGAGAGRAAVRGCGVREGARARPCVPRRLRLCVRAGARRGRAVGCCSLPGAEGKEGRGQFSSAGGPAAGVCRGCQVLEAEIGGVAERSCGGASEKRARHRLLLRSAFFLIASGEAAGRAALTCNSYHWGITRLTVSAAQLPLSRLD